MSEVNHEAGSSAISSHDEPADFSISSWILAMSDDSQKPDTLSGAGAISCAGKAAPQRPRRRVKADVPLRCIPTTSSARRPKVLWTDGKKFLRTLSRQGLCEACGVVTRVTIWTSLL